MSTEQNNTGASQPISEVEQLQARVAYLEARLVKAGEEGAALAAHVERLAELVQASINGIEWYRDQYADDFGAADEEHLAACEKALVELEESPSASLALLVAEKQAEALEDAANDCVPQMHKMDHWLRARASEKRRQAEEPRS